MTLGVIGLDFRTAGVERRERIARQLAGSASPLSNLIDAGRLEGAVLVSTCNRVELYWSAGPDGDPLGAARWLDSEDKSGWTILSDREAIEHLLRVTCGLESMVLGVAWWK